LKENEFFTRIQHLQKQKVQQIKTINIAASVPQNWYASKGAAAGRPP